MKLEKTLTQMEAVTRPKQRMKKIRILAKDDFTLMSP